jgi:hypothetical protein
MFYDYLLHIDTIISYSRRFVYNEKTNFSTYILNSSMKFMNLRLDKVQNHMFKNKIGVQNIFLIVKSIKYTNKFKKKNMELE